ncbi:DUF3427 domain-containing protein [Luteibacter jiangsuensis]|uniref:DUF3427 domain-containing protein n=1 Tax=Luteibacter jiangsuensis TaxID=637577 RepID=A0ABX0Q526_9GAMM|nr:DUF3427 domain-containing protein [Luteibacter jiangsuensis]NID05629.1 DUF3427 domain-containing protein [Luteibacter jiangsuensis]
MKSELIDLTAFKIGEPYSRAEVARVGAISPRNFVRPTGISEFANAVLLFVTLEKTAYSYHDQFDGDVFWWQSQTRQSQTSPLLRSLASGERQAYLFTRLREKAPSTLPFIYCGRLSAPLMTGEHPVTCEFEALDFLDNPTGSLAQIYNWRPASLTDSDELERRRELLTSDLKMTRARGQGRMRDYRRRRTIENYAMDLAKAHYAELGYVVTDTSSTRPFDLHCVKDGLHKRVEVKGTQSAGSTVEVTTAEVQSARDGDGSGYTTDLFIVHSVALDAIRDELKASGGNVRKIENWRPENHHLTPTVYRCQV